MALPQRSASIDTGAESATPSPHPYVLPRPGGRPRILTPETTAAICAIIAKEGISDTAAGALAGVKASTLSRWKQENEVFALELEAARALFELELMRQIRQTRRRDGSPDWRAAAWLLKHSSAEGCGPLSRKRKVKEPAEPAPHPRSENCAILPETPSAEAESQAPKQSRQERRAEERRQVKAMRTTNQATV